MGKLLEEIVCSTADHVKIALLEKWFHKQKMITSCLGGQYSSSDHFREAEIRSVCELWDTEYDPVDYSFLDELITDPKHYRLYDKGGRW